jgi:hypothetical protein
MDDRAKCPDQHQTLGIGSFFGGFEHVSSNSETFKAIR